MFKVKLTGSPGVQNCPCLTMNFSLDLSVELYSVLSSRCRVPNYVHSDFVNSLAHHFPSSQTLFIRVVHALNLPETSPQLSVSISIIMSDGKEHLLFDGEERGESDDIVLDQCCPHPEAHRLLKAENQLAGHRLRYTTFSSTFYLYFSCLHVVCLALGASLFWTNLRVPSSQDLAMLGM